MWHLSQPESGRRTKKQTGLKRDWESPPQLFWKTMENHENKTSLRKKPDFWIRESITRREGVSTLPRPSEGGTFN